jgi:hypothetical protein
MHHVGGLEVGGPTWEGWNEAGVSSLVNGGGSTAQGILAGENVVGSATNLFQSAQNESAYAGMSVSMDINELF